MSELQIGEDLRFQRRDWAVQRVGWCVIGLMLLAALLGLTGSGPLSHVTAGDGRGLSVEYDRFIRHGARTSLIIRVAPGASASDQARVAIGREYLLAHDLQRMVPEPSRTQSLGDRVEFMFDGQAGKGLQVRWTFEPDKLGRHAASVRLNDGPAVDIVQFTYP